MQQILIGIILVLGLGSYWLYNENNTLKANNKALEGAAFSAGTQTATTLRTNNTQILTKVLTLSTAA